MVPLKRLITDLLRINEKLRANRLMLNLKVTNFNDVLSNEECELIKKMQVDELGNVGRLS